MYCFRNPNPDNILVGDCVIRAISIFFNEPWDYIYDDLYEVGKEMKDMPSSNAVWGVYLLRRGCKRYIIPNTCPDCYTVHRFCIDHSEGEFLLSTGDHVIPVIDGNYYDTWDSGNLIPLYYYMKGE